MAGGLASDLNTPFLLVRTSVITAGKKVFRKYSGSNATIPKLTLPLGTSGGMKNAML